MVKKVQAQFDYEAQDDTELSFMENDIITVLKEDESGWWKGELNGKSGLFPSNFVEPYEDHEEGGEESKGSSEGHEEGKSSEPHEETPQKKLIGVAIMGNTGGMDELQKKLAAKREKAANIDEQVKKKAEPSKPEQVDFRGGLRAKSPPAQRTGSDKPTEKATPPPVQPRGPRPVPPGVSKAPPSNPTPQQPTQPAKVSPPKARPKPAIASKQKSKCKALYDYEAAEDGELSFKEGDIIILKTRDDAGWWQGELNGQLGWFPSNFVEEISESVEEKAKPPVTGRPPVSNKPPTNPAQKSDSPPPKQKVPATQPPPSSAAKPKPTQPPASTPLQPKAPVKKGSWPADLPPFEEFCQQLTTIFNDVKKQKSGKAVRDVDGELFGFSVVSADGENKYSHGDVESYFPLDESVLPFLYLQTSEKGLDDKINSAIHLGPSTSPSIDFKLGADKKVVSPFVPAGGLVLANLLLGPKPDFPSAISHVLEKFHTASGGRVACSMPSYLTALEDSGVEALAFWLKSHNFFSKDADAQGIFKFYSQILSVEVNCNMGAHLAATLANAGGKSFDSKHVQKIIPLLINGHEGVGVPATSGKSGVFMIVIPKVAGICIYSPRVNDNGLSVRGLDFSKAMVSKFTQLKNHTN